MPALHRTRRRPRPERRPHRSCNSTPAAALLVTVEYRVACFSGWTAEVCPVDQHLPARTLRAPDVDSIVAAVQASVEELRAATGRLIMTDETLHAEIGPARTS